MVLVKSLGVDNYCKCKWIKFSNQKAKSILMGKKKAKPNLQETHFSVKNAQRLKEKGWKQVFHASGNQRKTRVAISEKNKKRTD